MFILKDICCSYYSASAMKCPICRVDSLKEINLCTGLLARQCDQCFGHWISSEQYWEWLDSHRPAHSVSSQNVDAQTVGSQSVKPAAVDLNIGSKLLPVADNGTANFCADCARLMRKARVGRGLSFYIDRCSYCHGVWLDQNEWDNLKTMELNGQIHYIFSDAWQFSVRQERPAPVRSSQLRSPKREDKASA
jgi:Zn-finger nucleic acid-binding protein